MADAGRMMAPDEGFCLTGLRYRASGLALIDGIDLRLGTSGITMILGPNGAGKSLLLKLMHGLIAPSAGAITWRGTALNDTICASQAMVFQAPVLLRRSVASNMDFAMRAKGLFDPARRDMLLQEAGLLGQSDQPARHLSGGEKQRLALARALALSPEVLFLDEPTASLDPASVLMIEEMIRHARDTGTRILFVSHDVAQTRRLADDIVFLHRGRLIEHSPAETFFDHPASEAAAHYMAGRLLV